MAITFQISDNNKSIHSHKNNGSDGNLNDMKSEHWLGQMRIAHYTDKQQFKKI